jgi:signal transduction histidine kinase/CheY-like chemotaxis protein
LAREEDQIIELLSSVSIFQGVPENMLAVAAQHFHQLEMPAGVTFIKTGETDDKMYVIAKGQIKVHHGEETIAEMGPGELVGEMGLLGVGTRTMSVTSLTDVEMYCIVKEDFTRLMHRDADIAIGIVNILISRFRRLNNSYIEELQNREKELSQLVEQKTRDLQEKNAQLIQTQKFKETFLANMSHEIRTPLNAIVGIVNILRKTKVDEEQARYLKSIKDASSNLQVIIDEILDFSKLEAGKVELEQIGFRPKALLDLTYDILQFKAGDKNLEFSVNTAEEVPEVVLGDPVRINQVLINLAGNAIKFTENGFVRISVKQVSSNADVSKLRFEIQDSGIGISPEQKLKIFDQFSQASGDTNRKYGGTGLGLAISRQLVELHSGILDVDSVIGAGSTFWFEIPVPIGTVADLEEDQAESASAEELKGIRILLAEDNAMNVMVAVDTLEMEISDVVIEVAGNGQIALDMLEAADYDLVLMDVQMPEMDGYEATRKIRALSDPEKAAIPIIAMTANATRSEIQACFDAGMDEYLAKPFETQDLLEKMLKTLQKKNRLST